MAIIQANDIYMAFSGETLFKEINFSVDEKDKIGIIGVNGAGKTTLIKLLLGKENSEVNPETNERGTISKKSNLKIGYLAQNTVLNKENTIFEELMTVFNNLSDDYNRMQEINFLLTVDQDNFDKLMEKINYRFKNEEYLKEALTHRSYANENSEFKNFDNEKLEFLGDAVLNLIATEYIYSLGKGKKEGELAKLKSQIISEPVFSSIANDIELGNYLYLSNGEISSGGRKRKSILGDAFEALMGAIFRDSDYYTTKDVALRFILDKLDKLDNIEGTGDYKTILQEVFQSKYKRIPEYELTGTKGPDHNKVFEVSVKHNNRTIGHGVGKSKKEAEKKAAKEALNYIKRKK